MGGVTKVDVGICRIWVYLDYNAAKDWAAGCSIAGIIGGCAAPEIISKIAACVVGVTGVLIERCNCGNGVIIKIPHVLGMIANRPPEICSQ